MPRLWRRSRRRPFFQGHSVGGGGLGHRGTLKKESLGHNRHINGKRISPSHLDKGIFCRFPFICPRNLLRSSETFFSRHQISSHVQEGITVPLQPALQFKQMSPGFPFKAKAAAAARGGGEKCLAVPAGPRLSRIPPFLATTSRLSVRQCNATRRLSVRGQRRVRRLV